MLEKSLSAIFQERDAIRDRFIFYSIGQPLLDSKVFRNQWGFSPVRAASEGVLVYDASRNESGPTIKVRRKEGDSVEEKYRTEREAKRASHIRCWKEEKEKESCSVG